MSTGKSIIGIVVCVSIAVLVGLAGSQNGLFLTRHISLFAACGATGFILHWLVFIPSYIYQSEHYFDLTGSVSFVLATSLVLALSPAIDLRTLLIACAIIIWALRLGSFLFLRVKKAGLDRRFNEIKTRFWRFAFTWTLGGLWVFLTMAAPLSAITSTNKIAMDWLSWIGFALWIVGFVIEVVADHQKTRFRKDSGNSGKFISHGLWAWSRHPNYFGEILLWSGLSLMALPVLEGWQLLTLISPIFVFLLLTRVSGIPLLEKKADENWGSHEDYIAYKKRTSVLFPKRPVA